MLESNFASDLNKEKQLAILLDVYYQKHLKQYSFERVHDMKRQIQGIDIVLTRKTDDTVFFVDEKAQLDYINEALPTFSFELSYEKKGVLKEGWLYDTRKKTQFYALVTSIYSDAPNLFTSCKITLVNREKLLAFLATKNIHCHALKTTLAEADVEHGKIKLAGLNDKTEGYLFQSRKNKAEKPVNLILRLDFLIQHKIAKRLV